MLVYTRRLRVALSQRLIILQGRMSSVVKEATLTVDLEEPDAGEAGGVQVVPVSADALTLFVVVALRRRASSGQVMVLAA